MFHEAGALLKVLPAPLLAAHEGEEVAAGRVAALLLARLGVGHVGGRADVVAHIVRAALQAGCEKGKMSWIFLELELTALSEPN